MQQPPHPPATRIALCSLRIVPVRSAHFHGRRYVVELSTRSRARELRVYRTLDQLLDAVEQLGLPGSVYQDLARQLIETGSCNLLNVIV